MNRLILLGNGFDLAHGMKTSYNSFIFWYLEDCLESAKKSGEHRDILLAINYSNTNQVGIPNVKTTSEYVQFFYELGFKEMKKKVFKFQGSLNDHYNPFDITFTSTFFSHLLTICSNARWVDIENEYYRFLKQLSFSNSNDASKTISDLNDKFNYIIQQLQRYLSGLPEPELISEYKSIFKSAFNQNEFHVPIKVQPNQQPERTLVLNFNYTNTAELYFPTKNFIAPKKIVKFNYIHGQCQKPDNPIIFGFGDELDKDYDKLESHTSKDLFTYFKSFWYFKTSNYFNLIRFIDSTNFQVYILGHSCGLSDRTMLNMVFEHENCKSIKIFYYEKNEKSNFTETTQEISRHFKNKQNMRKKIVSLDKSSPMPQANSLTS